MTRMNFSEQFKEAVYAEERQLKLELDQIADKLKGLAAIRSSWEEVAAPVMIETSRPVKPASPKQPRKIKANPNGTPLAGKVEEVKKWINTHCATGETYSNQIVMKAFSGKYAKWHFPNILEEIAKEGIIERDGTTRSRNFRVVQGNIQTMTFRTPPPPKDPEEEEIPDLPVDPADDDDDDDGDGSAPVLTHTRFVKISTFKPIPLKEQGKLNKTKFMEFIGKRYIRFRTNRSKVKSPEDFWFLFNSTSMACEDLLAGRNEDWVVS